jgi:hypothetical protein
VKARVAIGITALLLLGIGAAWGTGSLNRATLTLAAFIQSGTGAVEISARDKMRQIIHAKDFGAVCDGTVGNPGTDNQTAFQNAITAAGAAGQVVFPTGKCSFSGTLQPAGNEQTWRGAGAGATQLNYTGAGDAIFIPDGLQLVLLADLGITVGSGAGVVALHIQGGPSGTFRNSFRNVSIYRQGGPNPVTGQKGIWLEYTSGSNGPWFNQFSDIWISFIDKPIVISAQANQNRFNGVSIEAFGTGATGIAVDVAGSENVFSGIVFSKGNGQATTSIGINCTGTYNMFIGAVADLGTGELYQLSAGSTLNVVIGGDASSGGGGTNGNAANVIWPGPGAALAVPKIRPSAGNLTLDAPGGAISVINNTFFVPGFALSGLGTPGNGAMLYCTDCLAGSNPCTASSTGAMAFRQNSTWKCL